MKGAQRDRCLELGVAPGMLEDEARCVDLRLPRFAWVLLDALAQTDDVSCEQALQAELCEWAVTRLRANLIFLERLELHRNGVAPPQRKRLYFMRKGRDGPIKIGVSENVSQRLKGVQNGADETLTLLVEVEQSAELNERALHKRFAAHRKTGEWFSPCAELLELIRRLNLETSGVGGATRKEGGPT